MQITLNQSEIEVALKQYISSEGISLKGKTIDISFTAGRKETGILAELTLNDVVRPVNEAVVYPPLAQLHGFAQVTGVSAAEPEVPQEPNPAERVDALVPEPQTDGAEPEPVPAAKTTSLFG